MPQFSQASRKRLAECHPDLITLFGYIIRYYDCTIVDAYRTKERQHTYFTSVPQRSKVDYPTVHNTKPCWAVDVAPFEGNNIDWGKLQSAHFAGFVMGIATNFHSRGIITHRVRNGADWNNDNNVDDTKFWDACHWELIPNEGDILNYQPV